MSLVQSVAKHAGLVREYQQAEALFSRRRLLFGGAAAGVLAAVTERARAGPVGSDARWLVQRITMGYTTEEAALADALGYNGYLEHHLNYSAIDDSALAPLLTPYTTLDMEPVDLAALPGGQVSGELTEATILRSIYSKRQLFERMVEFWTDHFNIDINNGADQFLKTVDDRDVIRQYALDTFPNLLSASAHSPAMLYYLNNDTSVAGNPNENYSRELMELHSMGVSGGYSQQDVQEVARCLTGWTIWRQNAGAAAFKFRYNSAVHDNGAKTVLGHYIGSGGGMNDGLTVLNILSSHPSTAQFISTKLCKWFWGETPPVGLITAVANTYTATGGDIKSMLRTLFSNTVPDVTPEKYKRPYHQFVSGLRATGASVQSGRGLRTQLSLAGQSLFQWSPPDGYPDSLDAWVGLILPRWNFGASLMNNNITGASVNIDVFLAGLTTAAAVMDRIDDAMFGGRMPAAQKERIRQYLLPDSPTSARKREAVGLAMAAPGFQWY